jgi:hypothetical protein
MIHFVLDKSKNYALVQQTLLDVVRRHLGANQWTAAVGKRRDEALNFSLFVRQPADVVMSHGVQELLHRRLGPRRQAVREPAEGAARARPLAQAQAARVP